MYSLAVSLIRGRVTRRSDVTLRRPYGHDSSRTAASNRGGGSGRVILPPGAGNVATARGS